MAVIVIEGPRLFGSNADTTKIETFSIGQTRDMDIWPEVCSTDINPSSNRAYAASGGRVRTPMIGGGASPRMYFALRRLMWLMELDERRIGIGQQGDLFGAYPHRPRKFIERHLDDGHGYFGLEILNDGQVRLRSRPLNEEDAMGQTDVDVHLPPTTPFQATYSYMPTLWKAIAKDNKKLGAFRGFHSY